MNELEVKADGMLCYNGVKLLSVEALSDFVSLTGFEPLQALQTYYITTQTHQRNQKLEILFDGVKVPHLKPL
jgi:hypothetical protein